MRAGEFPDGAHVLRLKIDMASPNVNMRDPAIYRIRHASHHRTGDKWCIYPLYDYTHCISRRARAHHAFDLHARVPGPPAALRLGDREARRRRAARAAAAAAVRVRAAQPHLRRAVEAPADRAGRRRATSTAGTIRGCRRWSARAAAASRRRASGCFAERIGVSKSDSWIDMSVLEDCMRDDLNARAQRRIAVLDPVRLVIDNYPGRRRARTASRRTIRSSRSSGKRALPFTRELWIERDDYTETPPKGYFRLTPGRRGAPALRLHREVHRRRQGRRRQRHRRALHVRPGDAQRHARAPTRARSRATSTGCPPRTRVPAEVRLYDRLFAVPFPGARNPWGARADVAAPDVPLPAHHVVVAGDDDDAVEVAERNYLDDLNPDSKRVITAFVEPALAAAAPEERVPVRAARLFRRRPGRPRAGQAGVQPHGDAARIPGPSPRQADRPRRPRSSLSQYFRARRFRAKMSPRKLSRSPP